MTPWCDSGLGATLLVEGGGAMVSLVPIQVSLRG